MLKKAFHIALTFLLLLATVGVQLNQHYCLGRLISVSINEDADTCEGMDGEEEMPCCRDQSHTLNVDDLTKVSFDFPMETSHFLLYSVEYPAIEMLDQTEPIRLASTHFVPPDPTPRFIKLEVFRI